MVFVNLPQNTLLLMTLKSPPIEISKPLHGILEDTNAGRNQAHPSGLSFADGFFEKFSKIIEER